MKAAKLVKNKHWCMWCQKCTKNTQKLKYHHSMKSMWLVPNSSNKTYWDRDTVVCGKSLH